MPNDAERENATGETSYAGHHEHLRSATLHLTRVTRQAISNITSTFR